MNLEAMATSFLRLNFKPGAYANARNIFSISGEKNT
jgi:hypothetical protein